MLSSSKIRGFGAYVPEEILSNADLEQLVDTTDEWIVQRTGMHERRIAADTEFSSDLAIRAVEDLIERHSISISDVDQIIVSSFTPDHFTPTIAGLIQGRFGMQEAGSFDLNAGCTGFTYAIAVADALISSGANRKVIVIAAETVSKVTDYTDRRTCILFGDAAAACLIERTEGQGAFLGRHFRTDGEMAHHVTCGAHSDQVHGKQLRKKGIFEQNGQQVYKYVMQAVPQGLQALVEASGTTIGSLDWFVPHSANMRMVQTVCDKLDFPQEKTLTSLEYYGNTSSASIPLALWLAQNDGRLHEGDVAALYGFGGGLTHGGVVVRL